MQNLASRQRETLHKEQKELHSLPIENFTSQKIMKQYF